MIQFHTHEMWLVFYSFWDWEKGERLDYFYNGNPRYTRITAMEYLNGHDCSLLLTATGWKHTNILNTDMERFSMQ